MTTYYAPKDHAGHLAIPDGCTAVLVQNCPKLNSITIPE